jgi:hypothetical protein
MLLVYLLTVIVAALSLVALFGSSSNFDLLRVSLTRYWVFIQDMDLSTEIKIHVQRIRRTLIDLQRKFLGFGCFILVSLVLVHPLMHTFQLVTFGSEYLINKLVPFDAMESKLNYVYQSHLVRILGANITSYDAESSLKVGTAECESTEKGAEEYASFIKDLADLASKYHLIVDQVRLMWKNGDSAVALGLIIGWMSTFACNGFIAFISLFVSLKITIILLARMEKLRLASLFFVCSIYHSLSSFR